MYDDETLARAAGAPDGPQPEILPAIDDPEREDALAELLRSEDPEVRREAAELVELYE